MSLSCRNNQQNRRIQTIGDGNHPCTFKMGDKRMDILSRTEPSFAANLEFTTIGMALISLNKQWMKINNKPSSIIGYSEEDLVNMNIDAILLPEENIIWMF